MKQYLDGLIVKGLPEVGKFVVREGRKILPALVCAAGVALYEEYSKYNMKRKLHKIYYNEGFKDGYQAAKEKLQEKYNKIINDKTLDDKEKVRRLNKYRKIINKLSSEHKQFKKDCDAIQNDKTLSDAEKNTKLKEMHNKFYQRMKEYGVVD